LPGSESAITGVAPKVNRTDESTVTDAGYGMTETAGAPCAGSSPGRRPRRRTDAASRRGIAGRVVMMDVG
jgi:hypothetical protein